MALKLSILSGQTAKSCFWEVGETNPYQIQNIAKIKDNLGEVDLPVTSIPSPFARLHLFNSAFSYVNEQYAMSKQRKVFDGNTSFHKLISDCLDVYELFYFHDILAQSGQLDIKLVSWTASKLKPLVESSKSGKKIFGEVLDLYIQNYNKDNRFVENQIINPFSSINIFLLNNQVFAGTSPFTGFFTAASGINQDIKNIEGISLFKFARPLYRRNVEFQRFMNLFFEVNNSAIQSFKELYAYVKINRDFIEDVELKKYVGELNTGDHFEDINKSPILYIKQAAIQILPNVQFRCKSNVKNTVPDEAEKSDYRIHTRKKLQMKPLALSNDGHKNSHWVYLYDRPLEEYIVIPDNDPRIVSERTLPGFDHAKYPYVLRNDFLSRNIIELPYDVNKSCFWMGNNEKIASNIILPINPSYFQYFTLEDLKENLSITKLASGAIFVSLKIPTKGANIKFERTYNDVNPSNIDNENNGAIIKGTFYLGIYPFFKTKDPIYNDLYKIAIFGDESSKIDCEFYRENVEQNKIDYISATNIFNRTRESEGMGVYSKYIELSKNLDEPLKDISFSFITVSLITEGVEVKGTIVPLMSEINSLSDAKSSVAFDIGTSNSYVAASLKGGADKLSTYNNLSQRKNLHFTMLHNPILDRDEFKGSNQYDINSRLDMRFRPLQINEFLPSIIGNGSEYNFPVRTIINQDNDCDANNANDVNILSTINIPFAFGTEKMREGGFDNAHSNLKWAISDVGNNAARNRLKAFIEQLVLMGRNYVLSNGLNPAQTNVMWFKPLSMATEQTATFENLWKEYYVKYFTKNRNVKKLFNITESWAPFYSYEKGFGAGKYFVSIDIGGGTTDILAFDNNKPSLTSSFRFAGNDLFDNGLNFDNSGDHVSAKKDNGFAMHFSRLMEKRFSSNNEDDKLSILNYILNSNELRSEDLVSFFFGVDGFSELVKLDKNFGLLFLLHNAAVFFHCAQILKIKAPDHIPSHIGLSGNGARLLEISNKSNDMNRAKGMANMVSYIFKHVFEAEETPTVKIHILDNPKESTAIGGIIGLDQIISNPTGDIDNYYISAGDDETLIHNNDYETKKKYNLKVVRDESDLLDKVGLNYRNFIRYFFEQLWFECDLPNNMGVDKSYNTEKLLTYFTDENNIRNVLDSIVNYKMDVEKVLYLNETLFFVPVKAYLYDFSKIIADENELKKFKGN